MLQTLLGRKKHEEAMSNEHFFKLTGRKLICGVIREFHTLKNELKVKKIEKFEL